MSSRPCPTLLALIDSDRPDGGATTWIGRTITGMVAVTAYGALILFAVLLYLLILPTTWLSRGGGDDAR